MSNREDSLTKNQSQQLTSDEQNLNYYQEYCRVYVANLFLTSQLEEQQKELSDLTLKEKDLDIKIENFMKSDKSRFLKKRQRRTAPEISRHFNCQQCNKSYGSEGSLNQHIRIKHHKEEN